MRSVIRVLLALFVILQCVNVACAQEDVDPYLWLEEVEGQKALDWVREKNDASLAVLKAQPGFEPTYQKVLEILSSDERIAYPQILGEYIYNFWQDRHNERGLWRRTTLTEYLRPSPQWEVLLDVDKLCAEEGEQWAFDRASGLYPDYKLFVIYLSRGGSDATVAREFDTDSKDFVKDGFILPEAKGSLSWKDRDTVYVQTDFGEGSLTDSGYPRVTKIWKRNTPLSSAKIIFEGQKTDMGVESSVINTPERQYDVVCRDITYYTSHTYVIENDRLVQLDIPDDAKFGEFFKNQMLIRLKTAWTVGQRTFKQGSLISID